MPELPEVQTVVNTLAPRLLGRQLCKVRHLRRDIVTPEGFNFSKNVTGRAVIALTRRGKRIVFKLEDGNAFYIHLGMTGRLTIVPRAMRREPHTHLIIDVEGTDLRFRDPRRFGGIWWLGSDHGDAKMGPEPLAMRVAHLARKLERTKRAIKNALMDQNVVAGLGNIYVDESLFAARIHPLKRADELTIDEIKRLTRSIKVTLRRALRHRGSTLRDYVDADGEAGGFQRLHRVYGREGAACRTCKEPIERIVLGGRSTHFCPRCQKM